MRNHLVTFFFALTALFAAAPGCAVQSDVAVETGSLSTSRPSFDLWEAADGWHFQLLARDADVLLESQAYSSRSAALNGVLSVIENGVDAGRYLLTDSATGTTLALRAGNNATIGDAGAYTSHADAEAARDATIAAVVDYQEWQANGTGRRFDIFEGRDGRFYFNLHAGNGEIVLRSQAYATEESALSGAFSVANFGLNQTRYDVRQATDGQWYFNLRASNGQVIGTSETYVTRYNAERARDSIIALLPTVNVL